MPTDLHVGFTGSSEHVTELQIQNLARTFRRLGAGKRPVLHHGDCVIADELAHTMAKAMGWRVEIHPPINPRKRAFCHYADVVHEPRDYLDRNTDIARACSVLVAAPDEPDEVRRSGTWSTIRRARLYGRRILIVQPDGIVREEEVRAVRALM